MAPAGIRTALGLTLLCLALVFLVPPFGAADEADHHTRIQGLASGTLVGAQGEPPNATLTPRQRPWVRQTTRVVPVPAGRSAAIAGFGCYAGSAQVGAACLGRVFGTSPARDEPTPVGTYEPLPYLLPAVVARLADHAGGADRWERLASLLPALALLLAAVLLAAPSQTLRAGVVLAASPATLSIAAGLGGSGLEVTAAIAFVTALVAPAVLPGRTRAALGLLLVAAPALVLARSLGPVWVLALALACAPLAWPWLRRVPRPHLAIGGAVLLAAVAFQRWWEARYGATPPEYGLPPAVESLKAGVRRLPDTLRESVGADGYLRLRAPWVLTLLWLGAVAGLVAAALLVATRRARVHLIATVAAALAVAPVLFAVATRYTGYGVQARHVLPLLVAVPVLAAARLAVATRGGLIGTAPAGRAQELGSAARMRLLRLPEVVPAVAAAVHVGMALVLAHRYAVGTGGPLWFPGHGWAPPGGWIPTLLAVLAGAALVATDGRARRREPGGLVVGPLPTR